MYGSMGKGGLVQTEIGQTIVGKSLGRVHVVVGYGHGSRHPVGFLLD